MRFWGDKGSDHTLYLADIHYDKFEQRSYIEYGNGVETHYTYRPDNRRLTKLDSISPVSGRFQNLEYTHDPVGNITDLTNTVAIPPVHHEGDPAPQTLGGPSSQHFVYDDLYRLIEAKGQFQRRPPRLE